MSFSKSLNEACPWISKIGAIVFMTWQRYFWSRLNLARTAVGIFKLLIAVSSASECNGTV
jgi:hypothetical protein